MPIFSIRRCWNLVCVWGGEAFWKVDAAYKRQQTIYFFFCQKFSNVVHQNIRTKEKLTKFWRWENGWSEANPHNQFYTPFKVDKIRWEVPALGWNNMEWMNLAFACVTATGHGRIIMQGLLWESDVGQAIGESSSPSNSGRSSREGAKVLTRIRRRHAIGRGREGALPPKRNETQKVSFELRQGRERSPFHGVRWKGKFGQ